MAGSADKPLILFELDEKILVRKGYNEFTISAASARVFARKLNRLALRIEKRTASGIETEGQDAAERLGAEHESPTAESGDAQP